MSAPSIQRTMGLAAATGIGIGAIVGGGILALAGVAFAATGPAALLAFALNGCIAVLTALSFAEMSTAFPESGGTYTFAKKVLSVRSAFAFGWVGWFASIVAGVLYAMGFAAYATIALSQLWSALIGPVPAWLNGSALSSALALGATAFYTLSLMRKSSGGGNWINYAKVTVFALLIAGGFWVLGEWELGEMRASMSPFLPSGSLGLLQAMGYTFITLQGFDLIEAVAGEVREPGKVLPRAMLLSLAAALAIYLPLLFIIATVGVEPGSSIAQMSRERPEVIVAVAVENYLGKTGFWLVLVAALLSMLSALQANLLAASRVALSMAKDHTLPAALGEIDARYNTPVMAICASALTLATILLVVPDVASAGAAASLIFLVSFALTHWTSILARRRRTSPAPFQTPLFPLVPIVGGLCCVGLAVFQGFSVPSAGLTASIWLGLGALLYRALLDRRARVVDASAEAHDPQLMAYRGRSPLVLVPIANPASAAAMVGVAHALAPPGVGRVLLLSVVAPRAGDWQPGETLPQLAAMQAVLGEAVSASFATGLTPEALTTIAAEPWPEIVRVSRIHRCESLLLGLSRINSSHIETLISEADCDVVVLHAPPGWKLEKVRRVLVPTAGEGGHDKFRARLLGNLCRTGAREVAFLRILPASVAEPRRLEAERRLQRYAQVEVPNNTRALVVRSDDVEQAQNCDLVVLGLQRVNRHRKQFGELALAVAQEVNCATVMISRRR
jgi:APA family basic amino acid/polyamine antiporter